MALSPIAFIAPNYRDFKGEWIKFYEPGTSTPKLIYLDSAGAVSAAKLQIDVDGFISSAGGAIVMPYVSGSYDAYIFATEVDADANNTISATRVADNIDGPSSQSSIRSATIDEMKGSILAEGQTAICDSYHAGQSPVANLVYSIQSSGNADGYVNHLLDNGLFAILVHDGTVNALQSGAYGDDTQDDTLALKGLFDYCFLNGATADFLSKTYRISGPITSTAEQSLDTFFVKGDGAIINIDVASAYFSYVIYLNNNKNLDVGAYGLTFNCNNRVANGFYVDVRDASPSTLLARGRCDIRIKVFETFKDSTITAPASGITVVGAFAEININSEVDGVNRLNNGSFGDECKGISVSDAVGVVRIDSVVRNVLSPTLDADGIAVFGRSIGTPADPNDFVFKDGRAYLNNCYIEDCTGRHIKIQTSECQIYSNTIVQKEIPMIAQSVSIAAQFGNGSIYNNDITYYKSTSGSNLLGSSHSVFDIANLLTDEEAVSFVKDNKIKTESLIPRIINFTTDNTSSATVVKASSLVAEGNTIYSVRDLAGLTNVIRGFIETSFDELTTNGLVEIACNENTFSGESASRLISYTGYTTGDVSGKLKVTALNNANVSGNNVHVFKGLSGNTISTITFLKLFGNTGLDHYFTGLTLDLFDLPEGTDFNFDIGSSTLTDMPATAPASGTGRIVTGNSSFNTGWKPQQLTTISGAIKKFERIDPTWYTII